jgi:sterol desaturase/sphingolipid hydroxylase (fatty acid hydroxylase superfamily)
VAYHNFKDVFCRWWRRTPLGYYSDFFVTTPLTLYLFWQSLHHLTVWYLPLLALGGFAWTFYEYALHRWGLHKIPLLHDVHDMHHADPSAYIGTPPYLTWLFYAITWSLFGFQASPVMAGYSLGYVSFACAHTMFHYYRFTPQSWFHNMYQRHVIHHTGGDSCFGVTTGLWDYVFSTEAVK